MNNYAKEPSPELFNKIIERIRREERLLVFRRIIIFSGTLSLSAIAFMPTFKMLWQDFESSGFFHFASLAFSDFEIIKTYWQNFALNILEILPVISIITFSFVLLVLLQSLRSLAKNIKIVLNTNRLANGYR